MIKITLDTNCIINLLDHTSVSATSVDEIAEILRYALDGDINIAITTRVETDVQSDNDETRKQEFLKRLTMFPVIGTIARYETSTWNGGDVWAGADHVQLEKTIQEIVFPGLTKEDGHYKNKIIDIDHLVGHVINKRDIFVTDDKQILKKSETLKSTLSMTVMNPSQALEYINLQGNKVVLVEEFSEKISEYKEIVLKSLRKGMVEASDLSEYEILRKWLIRKYPALKDGLLHFRLHLKSVVISKDQSMIDQGELLSLETFNDRIVAMLQERDPLAIPQIASSSRHDSWGFLGKSEEVEVTLGFFNSLEDTLLAYIGKLESA